MLCWLCRRPVYGSLGFNGSTHKLSRSWDVGSAEESLGFICAFGVMISVSSFQTPVGRRTSGSQFHVLNPFLVWKEIVCLASFSLVESFSGWLIFKEWIVKWSVCSSGQLVLHSTSLAPKRFYFKKGWDEPLSIYWLSNSKTLIHTQFNVSLTKLKQTLILLFLFRDIFIHSCLQLFMCLYNHIYKSSLISFPSWLMALDWLQLCFLLCFAVARRTVPYGMSSYRGSQRVRRSALTSDPSYTSSQRCVCSDQQDSDCRAFCKER